MKSMMTEWFKSKQRATTPATPAERPKTALMMQLEPRIMFDGAAVATTVDIAHQDVAFAKDLAVAENAPVDVQAVAPSPQIAETPVVNVMNDVANIRNEIIFVDTSVENYQSLLTDLNPDAEVVFITAQQDGLQVIADTLQGRSDIDAIHILSHGDTGRIQLGNDWIDSADVASRSDLLAAIGQSLNENGDILLYGCYVGTDGAGIDFIKSLASATNADVAASTDLTGAKNLGGDWVLEATQGNIETLSLDLANYSDLLVTFSDDFSSTTGSGVTSFTRTLGGVSYTFTFTSDGDGGDFAWENANGFGGSASVNMLSGSVTGAVERVTIARTDAADFTFDSIFIDNASGGTTNVRGYLDAVAVGSNQTMTAGTSGTLTFSSVRVDQVQITSTDFFGTNFDNFAGDTSPPNTAPAIANLNGDSVAWAGVGSTVTLDASGNASLTDTELDALNSGNGNWSGASLTVQRSTAVSADTFGFNTSGALFTVSGSNLQSGGLTFATYTNSGGVLTVNFTDGGTTPTTALVNDVTRHITYRNDTPAGDATVRFTLHDGTVAGTAANVTVTSDSIYVTNTTDTATINAVGGVSFSEAIAVAAADVTGSQTIIFDSSLAGQTVSTSSASSLGESVTVNLDSASGVTLSGGTLSIGSGFGLTVTNGSSDTASIATNLSGAGNFIKTGAGTATLSGTNSYTGTTTVSAGTLSVASDGNLGSGTVTLATGTTLAVTGATTIDNAIALSGNATVQAANAVTLSGGISGAGGLTKTGAGTLTLSSTNGFTGNVAVSAGGLTLSNGAAIADGSAVTMSSGTTLTLSSSEIIGSLAGTGTVALGANTLTAGGDNTSTSFAGSIGGSGGGLSKAGAGTLTLSGTNSYTGATTISAGAIDAQNGDAIGNSSAVSVASGAFLVLSAAEAIGSLAGAGSISQGANTLTTGGNNTSTTFSGDLNGNGALVKAGSGTLTLSNAGNSGSMSGDITVSGGSLSVASDNNLSSGSITLAGGSTLDVTGATTIDNAITLTGDATVSNSANASLSGNINGAHTLTKSGASTLTLSGSNSHAATTVSAGTLSVASDGNLGNGAVSLASGTTLAISGATNFDNSIVLGGNATVSTSANATLSGVISGANNFTKAGASTLTLSGSNTYSTTTVSAGTLSVAADANLGSGAVTLASGSTLAVTGATTIDNAIALSGGTATVNASANATLSSNITGAGGLTKAGASTLTLSGSDSYSGATNVNAGTLLVNGALSATSNTTVASGATLGGSGSISSNVTVNSGGTLSPGNSAGTTTINGNLTMASGSTLAVEINGATAGSGYDQVIVNGAVDVSGATLSVTHGYTAGSGDTYNIIVNDAADAVTGTFSGLSEGATVTAGGNGTVLTASYIGTTGNDVTLTAPVMPYVTNVSVLDANGTYNIGDTVTVSVDFSEQIFLSTGTIQLTLETGTTDRSLSYVAGSGSLTLYFNYTVQVGDNSLDLDYISTSGLAANGDTIQSASFIDAVLTLPTPGAAGSIAANKAIVIDGVRPTASIVVADTALNIGETSLVTFTFSEAVSGFTTADLTVANGNVSGLSTGDGGITWTATLTPTTSITDTTNLITLDKTGVADAAGNSGSGTTDSNNYAIDTLSPSATIVVADTALTAGETSSVTITFNEAITGFTTADLTVANGSVSSLSTGDGGITWTATLTPTASVTDTTNLITLDNTGVQDSAGNAGTGTTDSNNYAIDTARPTASIVVADTALAAGETSLVTITFNEAVSGLTTADLTVANGNVSGLNTGDGGVTWTATLTPTTSITDTTNLITLDNTGIQDIAGNAGTGTTDSNNYAIDTARPTASIVVADTALAVGETSLVTITFNEAVTGLAIGDFTAANGVLSGLSSGDGGITWTATLTPTASTTDTSNLVTLDNTGVADAAGNSGTGTTDSNNYAIDTVRPTASIVIADTALAAGETSLVTITFSEAVTGFTTADLTVANGSVSGLSTGDGGVTWTATLTPTASITDTSNLITLDNTGVQDMAGNAGTGTTDSNNYAIDTTRPTVSIVVADTALAAGETSLVTITFSEAVTGFTNADLTIANGTLSAVSSSDGGITWAATFTPTASITDTTNLITIANTGVQDASGNTGTGSTDSNNYAIDTARPTASIVVADTALAAGETSLVTITFSEAVTGFTNADLTIANGILSAVSSGDGGITWTATFTPTDSITDTTNLITLDNTGLQDLAGNAGSGSTDSNNYALDTARPVVNIDMSDYALGAGETATVTFTFSEAVSGFTNADLTLANGTLSAVSSADGGITWTATFTPTTDLEDTTNIIGINNTGYLDAAGNTGTGTTGTINFTIDTLRPTATVVVADTALAAGETSLVTITMSEAVANFDNADLSVANGTLSTATTSDGGITWTATLTPNADITDTTNLVTFDSSGVIDGGGNVGAGAINSNNYSIDTYRPTSAIVVADSALAVGETSLVTITFNEAVTGFTNADLTVANGTLSAVSSADGGITWTATFTPTASITDTTNLITIANNGVQDAAGNTGTGATDSNNYAIDSVRPTASIVVADSALAAGETSLVTFTFSEAVTGFSNADLTVANGALSAVSSADGGITWTATFTPTASITDTTNLITVAITGLQDAAGNTGTGTTDSNNYTIDTARPAASIMVADTALVVGETSLVTITFSEAVTGFTNADLTIANGTLSAVSSSDGGITWTATFTPAIDVTDTINLITLDNLAYTDLSSNTGTGTSDSNNYAIDTLRPTATIVVEDSALSVSETSVVTITFNEAVSGLTNADLTIANGTLSAVSSTDGGTVWTATLTPTSGVSDDSNLITLNNTGVTDAAGNTGVGTTDSNNYVMDILGPTASIVVADSALGAAETSLVTITFSEAVTGFTNADLTIANGTLSAVSSADGGITWTATFTPTSDIEDTTNIITLNNVDVLDVPGNAGTGTTDSNNYSIETTRPTPSIVIADAALIIGETSLVTITFSEAVTGFTNSDLTIANGTLTMVSSSDGGTTWTATFTPAANITDTTNLITLANTGVQDAAGNSGSGTTDSNSYAVDTQTPLVASVNMPADGFYNAGDTLSFTLNTTEIVQVDTSNGTPRLVLNIGGTTRYANYLSGSGTSALLFQYQVQAGDNGAVNDGLAVSSLALNGGSITDVATNPINLTLNNPGDLSDVVVDTTAADVPDAPRLTGGETDSVSPDVIFQGSNANPNEIITLFENGVALGFATVDANGNWVISVQGLAVGEHAVTSTVTDQAGNVSQVSAVTLIQIVPPVQTPESQSPSIAPTTITDITPFEPAQFIVLAPSTVEIGGATNSAYPMSQLAALDSIWVDIPAHLTQYELTVGNSLSIVLPRPSSNTSGGAFSNEGMFIKAELVKKFGSGTGTEPLPSWLHFDPVAGTLTGTPPKDVPRHLSIKILLQDGKGQRTHFIMELNFRDGKILPNDKVPPEGKSAPDKDAPQDKSNTPLMGKPALSDQFNSHGQGAHVRDADALLHALHQIAENSINT